MKDEILQKLKNTQLYAIVMRNKKAATAVSIGVVCLFVFFGGGDDTQRYSYASSGYASNSEMIRTTVDGEWEGCDFEKRYRLMNGLVLKCSTYFYEYAYMPKVEILLVDGRVDAVSINGKYRRGVSVYR